MLSSPPRWLGAVQFRRLLLLLVIAIISFFLFGWRLGNLTPGLSQPESLSRSDSQSLSSISKNPLNAPLKLIQHGFQASGHNGAFWMRLGSVAISLLLLGCFYYVARLWFGKLVALLSSLLLATTPWIVLTSRSATYSVLLLWPIVILASYLWLVKINNRHQRLAWLCLIVSSAIGLYVPGVVWLLPAIYFSRKSLAEVRQDLSRGFLFASAFLSLVLILPLVIASINQPSIIKNWLLIPAIWPGFFESLKSILWSGLSLSWHTRQANPLIVGRLPLLDITQLVLIAFGLFIMWQRARSHVYALIGVILLAILASGLNYRLSLITLALPAVSLIVAAGLRYLYLEWQQIFPKNPLPRALALLLMICLIGLHVIYGLRYSLIAWPHNLETRKSYVIK